jgi:hypothetical protein
MLNIPWLVKGLIIYWNERETNFKTIKYFIVFQNNVKKYLMETTIGHGNYSYFIFYNIWL